VVFLLGGRGAGKGKREEALCLARVSSRRWRIWVRARVLSDARVGEEIWSALCEILAVRWLSTVGMFLCLAIRG
jgi:hypothetical protein